MGSLEFSLANSQGTSLVLALKGFQILGGFNKNGQKGPGFKPKSPL